MLYNTIKNIAKNFLEPAFLIVVIVLLLVPAQPQTLRFSTASAQTQSAGCSVTGTRYPTGIQGTQDGNGGCVVRGDKTYSASDKGYSITNDNNGTFKDNGGKSMTLEDDGVGCGLGNISLCLTNVVYVFTAGIMSVFAYIGGYVLSMGVALSLNSFAYAQSFLSVGWTAVRDIANIAFIFILLYLAFVIILQAETSGTMRTLAMVIIMALLINFSFFITRVVIDGGNVLAVQFYNQINAPSLETTSSQGGVTGLFASAAGSISPANTKDLTAGIMNVMHLQNLFSSGSFNAWINSQKGISGGLTTMITLSLLYVVIGIMLGILAATFFFVGFKFIYRLVVLWAVIIGAPLAFVARALTNSTKAKTLYHLWQDSLIKFSFYPAIFLFSYLIISYILQQLAGAATAGPGQPGALIAALFNDLNSVSANNNDGFAIILGKSIGAMSIRLGIVIIMLYYGMRIADTLVDHGNGAARGFTSWMGQRIGGLTYGTFGLVGRNTVGRGLQAAGATAGQVASTKQSIVGQRLWSGISRGATVAGKSSFDVRTTTVQNTVRDITGKAPTAQLDIGKGGRGGSIKSPRFPSGPQTKPQTATPAAVILRTQTPAQQQAIDQVANAQVIHEDQERRRIPGPGNDNYPPQPIPAVAGPANDNYPQQPTPAATGPVEQPRNTKDTTREQQPKLATTPTAFPPPPALPNTPPNRQEPPQAPSIQFADSGRMRELLQSIRTNGTTPKSSPADNRSSSLSSTSLTVGANTIATAQNGALSNTSSGTPLPNRSAQGFAAPSQKQEEFSQTYSSQSAAAAARIAQASYRETPSAPSTQQTLWQTYAAKEEKREDKKDVRAIIKELRGIRELLKHIANNPTTSHTSENKSQPLELKNFTFNPGVFPHKEPGNDNENTQNIV